MKKNKSKKIFDPERTKELQNDWQSFGATSAYYGLIVLFFVIVSIISQMI